MKTTVENLDPVQVKLTVEVEPKRVKQAFDRAARELAKQVSLPGFRPGKAPRRLLEQRFGAGAIAQTAMDESLSTFYAEALDAEDLHPVAQPEVDIERFDEHEGAAFTATIQVRPSFDPPDHTGIGVSFPDWEVDDAAVDEQLASMRERFAEVDVVERPARTGDMVTLSLEVEIDGEHVDNADVEDALYEVGSAGVTPKLDDEVVGKQAGDTFSYDDTMPEGYPEHGGKPATFRVTITDVRAKTLPELDDDFAATASGLDTIDELRADVRSSLTARRIREAEHELRARVLEAYLARVDLPLPPAMIDDEVADRRHQLEHQAESFGTDLAGLLEAQGTTEEEFTRRTTEQATSGVKAQLVLDALANQLGLGIEASDLDQEILRHARSTGMEPQEVARVIQEQGSLPALIGDILRRKAIDAVVDAAQIDGAPSHETLVEVGLRPPEPADDDTDDTDDAGDADGSEDTDR